MHENPFIAGPSGSLILPKPLPTIVNVRIALNSLCYKGWQLQHPDRFNIVLVHPRPPLSYKQAQNVSMSQT